MLQEKFAKGCRNFDLKKIEIQKKKLVGGAFRTSL